jgi:Raf kinase inhibitor-like YbhB/YbcL family protein
MLENLPAGLGRALRTARPGIEQTLFYDAAICGDVGVLVVTSPEFGHEEEFPVRYTEDGARISPPIAWQGVPAGAQSVVVAIEDADSPTPAPLVHAIVWNLPPTDGALSEGAMRSGATEGDGLSMGRNSCFSAKYLPPDPPPGHGPHRYVIQVFALNCRPDLGDSPGRSRLIEHLKGHVLAKGLLVGIYERL